MNERNINRYAANKRDGSCMIFTFIWFVDQANISCKFSHYEQRGKGKKEDKAEFDIHRRS